MPKCVNAFLGTSSLMSFSNVLSYMHFIIIIIINNKNNITKILNTETDSKCRQCQQFDETIDHIISACLVLAKEQYIKDTIECVHNYTSTYVRKQGYSWTKNTGTNMSQNQ
jgi:hypothetical protein